MTQFAENIPNHEYHRFLDEAGDTTFFGKGKIPIVGENGVSNCFILRMLKFKEPLEPIRLKVIDLQNIIVNDVYFNSVPSINKKINTSGYFLHAKDDIPEIRKMVFDLIQNIDCSFEAMVGRKIYKIYETKHNGKESEFYADLLAHLLKNKLTSYSKLVLNISNRGKCTSHINLQKGLDKAFIKSSSKNPNKSSNCIVNFKF